MKKRVAILISGRGSNMEALIKAAQNDDYPAKIVLVISNKDSATGLEIAEKYGINNLFISHKNKKRETFDKEVSTSSFIA